MIKNFIFNDSVNGRMENSLKVGVVLIATDGQKYKILSDQPFNAGCNKEGTEWELQLEALEIKGDIIEVTEIIDSRDLNIIDALIL